MRRSLAICVALVWGIAALVVTGHNYAADLPPETFTAWTWEKEIFVRMRDGVHLSTDVLLPKGSKGKLPTILIRTPYEFEKQLELGSESLGRWLKRGYAVVLQSERGHGLSEGVYTHYLEGDSTDGYDTVGWIAKQPWSNGKVGAIGCSSSGESQWPMAASNPPGLAAVIPMASGVAVGDVPGNATQGAFYRGGVPLIGFWVWWYSTLAPTERPLLPAGSTPEQRIRIRNGYSFTPRSFDLNHDERMLDLSRYKHLPSKDILRSMGGPLTPFDNYITWTPADPRWHEAELIRSGARPQVPALHVVTWHDPAVGETTRLFKYLEDFGTPNQYLIVGAGSHCSFTDDLSWLSVSKLTPIMGEGADLKVSDLMSRFANFRFGDLQVGDARYGERDHGYSRLFLDWFGYWLNGEPNSITGMPKVQLYVMGKGWISGDRWPLQQMRSTNYYLGADGLDKHPEQTGTLLSTPQDRNESETYIYDPGSPTPTLGGGWETAAALDQRPILARRDVLTYETPPLQKSTTIAGPIQVVLYVSSSARDTDFMVKLVDVYPDGKAINLSEDAFRVRYRDGFDRKVLMERGKVYKITLTNMVTAVKFPTGHRIGLVVSSSNFPAYERNLNTGGNNYDEVTWVVAENTIHYGRQYPSHLVLPLLLE